MAKDVRITVDERKLRHLRLMLAGVPRGIEKVMYRAINKTARSARTQITRALSKETGLTQKNVRNSLYCSWAQWKKWRAWISISDRDIPIINLKPRKVKRGISYSAGAGRKRNFGHGAFIATMPSGHRGVFVRDLKNKRLPIDEQYELSLSDHYEDAPQLAATIQKENAVKLEKNIDVQVELLLNKARGAA